MEAIANYSLVEMQDSNNKVKSFYDMSSNCRRLDIGDEEGDDNGAKSGSTYPEYCKTIKVQDSNGSVKELVFPKALDLDRPKRARTTFSPEQLFQLEKEFQRNQYLVGRERTDLSKRLRLSETQVKVWFQNRRTKYKRDRMRDAEVKDSKAESFAACNILRMLQQEPPTFTQCAPVNSSFPLYNPYTYMGYSST